jgi:hypothetical protein
LLLLKIFQTALLINGYLPSKISVNEKQEKQVLVEMRSYKWSPNSSVCAVDTVKKYNDGFVHRLKRV